MLGLPILMNALRSNTLLLCQAKCIIDCKLTVIQIICPPEFYSRFSYFFFFDMDINIKFKGKLYL